jgi:predicted methyltransferase
VLLVALNVPALVAGARLGGAPGIAVGLIAVQLLIGGGVYARVLRPSLGLRGRAYAAATLKPMVLAAGMAVAVAAVPEGPARRAALVLLAQIALGAGAYTLLIALTDRAAIRQLATLAVARA